MDDIKEQLLSIKTIVHNTSIDVIDGNKDRASDNKTTYSLMFISGVVFGMSDEKWRPYASFLYEAGKEIFIKG